MGIWASIGVDAMTYETCPECKRCMALPHQIGCSYAAKVKRVHQELYPQEIGEPEERSWWDRQKRKIKVWLSSTSEERRQFKEWEGRWNSGELEKWMRRGR